MSLDKRFLVPPDPLDYMAKIFVQVGIDYGANSSLVGRIITDGVLH